MSSAIVQSQAQRSENSDSHCYVSIAISAYCLVGRRRCMYDYTMAVLSLYFCALLVLLLISSAHLRRTCKWTCMREVCKDYCGAQALQLRAQGAIHLLICSTLTGTTQQTTQPNRQLLNRRALLLLLMSTLELDAIVDNAIYLDVAAAAVDMPVLPGAALCLFCQSQLLGINGSLRVAAAQASA
eukprot:17219-Heterococcus_DN1.PRE.1